MSNWDPQLKKQDPIRTQKNQKGLPFLVNPCFLAGPTGLEPATSGVKVPTCIYC